MITTSSSRGAVARLALSLALLAGSCAPAPRPAAPAPTAAAPRVASASPTWLELTSEHVVLRTDLAPQDARDAVNELELMRALLAQALSLELPGTDDRVEVYAFATREELLEFTGEPEVLGTEFTDGTGRQRIVLGGRLSDYQQGVAIAHEMAHALSYRILPRQPKWFGEGLAQYLSSVARIQPDGSRAVGALPSPSTARLLEDPGPAPVRALFSWDTRRDEVLLYATSWLLVRHLATHRPDDLAAYERRLTAGDAASQAWSRSFPEWSPDVPGGLAKLDAILAERARDLGGAGPRVAARAAVQIRSRRMTTGEVRAVRLTLPRKWKPGQLRDEVEAALQEDPDHVAALTLLAADPSSPRLQLASRAVKAHPADADAWLLLARCLPSGAAAERVRALKKALDLAPDRPDIRVALAAEVVYDDPTRAEALARQAVERVPWSTDARATRALALSGVGRCDEAAAELQRSVDMVRAEPSSQHAVVDEALRVRLQRHCTTEGAFRAAGLLRRARDAGFDSEYEEALGLADRAVAADAAHPDAWDDRGEYLLALGRLEDAEASFRRQLALAPRHLSSWSGLGRALTRLGRWADAEQAFREQLEVTPDSASAQVHLGEALTELQRPREAVAVLEKLATWHRDDPFVLVELGRARLAAGQDRLGMADLEHALRVRDTAQTLNNAAYILTLVDKHLDRAVAWVERSIRRCAEELRSRARRRAEAADASTSETLLSAWDTLGWVRFRQGQLDEAERWVRAALGARANAECARHLGEILERRGLGPQAAEAFALALTLEPDPSVRARVEKLVGPARAAELVAGVRRDELRRRLLGRVAAPRSAPQDRRIQLVLGPDGAVLDALPSGGEEVSGAREVAGLRHAVPFPAPAPPRMVLPGRYRCADGVCAWFLGSEPLPPGPLPF